MSAPHDLSVPLCLFLCERTCLSARKGYKDTSEVRGNAHATISWSLSVMNTTWLNTAQECFAQTLSGARLSQRMYGARTFHERTAQPCPQFKLFTQTGSWGRRRALMNAHEQHSSSPLPMGLPGLSARLPACPACRSRGPVRLAPSSRMLFASGEGDSGGHVLRETTSRGLCGLVCPLRTSERGGEGDCVKEGGGEEGERERERGSVKSLHYSPEEHGTV